MLDEQLKKRGRAIVDELDLGNDQTTEKWMAHYLAELMDRAENAESPELREGAAEQSANIILTLWEQKISKARQGFYGALNASFSHVYNQREFAERLKLILEDPEQFSLSQVVIDQIAILLFIDIYEIDLLRLYLIVNQVKEIQKDEVTEEVISEFQNNEERFIKTKQHLQDIWPDLELIGLTQVAQLEDFITKKLQDLHKIRSRFFS